MVKTMRSGGRRVVLAAVTVAAVLILGGLWSYEVLKDRSIRSSDAAAEIGAEVRRQLNLSDSAVRRFVEEAHRTVTVKTLDLTKCEVRTADGSGVLKEDLSNLLRVDIEITASWNGWFHKSGKTVVGYFLLPDGDGKVCASPLKVLSTTALYTRDDRR